MQDDNVLKHCLHITTLCGSHGSDKRQVVCSRLAYHSAYQIPDHTLMNRCPFAGRITPRSWGTVDFWGDMRLQIVPGVVGCIFLPSHPTSPPLSCKENPDLVRHRTGAPLVQRAPSLSIWMVPGFSAFYPAVLLDTGGTLYASSAANPLAYRHGAVVQSNARRRPASRRFSISCTR